MAQSETFPNQMKTIPTKSLELTLAQAVSQLAGMNCTVTIDRVDHGCDGDCKGNATRFELRVYQTFTQSIENQPS